MIDEAATFKQFGYYSTDLTSHSNKKIISACEGCGKVRELHKHGYRALCPSCSQRGEKNHNHRKHPLEVTRKKMSEAQRGKKLSEATRKKLSEANAGKKLSEAHRKKLSEANAGKKLSEAHRKKISDSLSGDKNWNWQGGKRNTYCEKWTEYFREYIRDKYDRKCFLCGKTEEENCRRLSVHHVNGNKKCGCDRDITCQFIPLCTSCHGKVHASKKDYTETITNKMKCELKGWYI